MKILNLFTTCARKLGFQQAKANVQLANDDFEQEVVQMAVTQHLVDLVEQWHHDRNLIDGATDQAQLGKLVEELGELAANINRGKDIRDDIGDMIVVLINIATRNGVTLRECLEVAYNDIRYRKGKMVNGTFVKEADL